MLINSIYIMGNLLCVVSDRKLGQDEMMDGKWDYYLPDVINANDYYPFGLEMPGRTVSSYSHRFGFNGKERDSDMNSVTHYDYGFRIYNPGIGRFLSVDPLAKEYPWYTPYQFAGNKPIIVVDLDGLEEKVIVSQIGLNNDGIFEFSKFELTQTTSLIDHGKFEDFANWEKYGPKGTLYVTLIIDPIVIEGNIKINRMRRLREF